MGREGDDIPFEHGSYPIHHKHDGSQHNPCNALVPILQKKRKKEKETELENR